MEGGKWIGSRCGKCVDMRIWPNFWLDTHCCVFLGDRKKVRTDPTVLVFSVGSNCILFDTINFYHLRMALIQHAIANYFWSTSKLSGITNRCTSKSPSLGHGCFGYFFNLVRWRDFGSGVITGNWIQSLHTELHSKTFFVIVVLVILRQGLVKSLNCAGRAWAREPSASAFWNIGITGMCHHAWFRDSVPTGRNRGGFLKEVT